MLGRARTVPLNALRCSRRIRVQARRVARVGLTSNMAEPAATASTTVASKAQYQQADAASTMAGQPQQPVVTTAAGSVTAAGGVAAPPPPPPPGAGPVSAAYAVHMTCVSYWVKEAPPRTALFPPLPAGDAGRYDVAVIGGGVVGLLAAYTLSQDLGKRVILLEARDIGGGTTGFSTAKLTSQHGLIYHKLGAGEAALYAQLNQEGLALFDRIITSHGLACGYTRRAHSVFTEDASVVDALRKEADAVAATGAVPDVAFMETVPELPPTLAVKGAVHFGMQALCNMYAFSVELAQLLASKGVAIHESTRVIDVPSKGAPHVVVTEGGGTVTADCVIMATHLPITDRSRHFAVTEPARSYCLAVTLTDPARVPQQGYINAETPTRSLRPAGANNDVLVVAGSGHKMGASVDTRAPYAELEAWTRLHFPVAQVLARWSAFDYLSADAKPFIGPMTATDPSILTVTGLGKWGFTASAGAALIFRDLLAGKPNAWLPVVDATRWHGLSAVPGLLSEQGMVIKHFAGSRLAALAAPDISTLAPGEGGIVTYKGRHVMASRDAATGALTAVEPACKHLGCMTVYNPAEKTIDCACHGSRYAVTGEVLHGPAVHPLARVPLEW